MGQLSDPVGRRRPPLMIPSTPSSNLAPLLPRSQSLTFPKRTAAHHVRRASRDVFSSTPYLRSNKSASRFFADVRLVVVKSKPRHQLTAIFALVFLTLFTLIFLVRTSRRRNHSATHPNRSPHPTHKDTPPTPFWPTSSRTLRYKPPSTPTTLAHIQETLSAPPSHLSFRLFRRRPKPAASVPTVSLLAACSGRTGYLQRALPTWLDALAGVPAEIVLVDWPDPRAKVPLQAVSEALGQPPGLQVVTVRVVEGAAEWALTRAYNLAATVARGRWLLKVDCDVGLAKGVVERVVGGEGEGVFYRGDWRKAVRENDKHLNGVFAVRRPDFWAVHGFDERLLTYGWDDEDLYSRLEKKGLKKIAIGDGLVHLDRESERRSEVEELLSTEMNQISLEKLAPWDEVEGTQKTSYEFGFLEPDCRFLTVKLVSRALPALKQLKESEQRGVAKESKLRVLHDWYQIPWGVLSEINRSPSELVNALADSPRGLIFCEVGGSTAQRVLGIASAVAFARRSGRTLFLSWSSGKREGSDEVPRIADLFDLETSGMMKRSGARRRGVSIFQIGKWKCRSAIEICAQYDSVYGKMIEFRTTTSNANDASNMKALVKRLTSGVQRSVSEGNILLRLEGLLPLQEWKDVALELAELVPSRRLIDQISLLGDVSTRVGIYLGRGIRSKGLDAMLRRLGQHVDPKTKYFVSGVERERVKDLRARLSESSTSNEAESEAKMTEVEQTVRDVAELFALASCSSVVNDGRIPQDVISLVKLIKLAEKKRSQEYEHVERTL